MVLTAVDPAEAQRRQARNAYSPPYAAIVVDVNSGQVMHARNADALRHPASLTKIMTLYMLFEQLDSGKLRVDSELPVSAYAAARPPSKLGLRVGQTIAVDDAIKALVTRSANDVAVVVAEAIGGSESNFARMMTQRAQSLGMTRTVYTNASGLPDRAQVTTAREQAILGRAIQERFPRLYRYFATSRFHYRGRVIANHNRLLGTVPGVDGIKTGFIRASGFNLVSSMRRNDRHIVAVVIGGSSGRARDARMRSLLEGNIMQASARRTAPPLVAQARPSRTAQSQAVPIPPARPGSAPAPMPVQVASAQAAPAQASPAQAFPAQGTVAKVAAAMPPVRPAPVAGAMPRPAQVAIASAGAAGSMALTPPAPVPGSADPIRPHVVRTVTMRAAPGNTGSVAAMVAEAPDARPAMATAADETPPTAADGRAARQVASAGAMPAAASGGIPNARPETRGEWVIQVGAFPAEEQAHNRIKAAQSVGGSVLAGTAPFTQPVARGQSTLYRARFAGFDRGRAQAACRHFQRNEIACLALRE